MKRGEREREKIAAAISLILLLLALVVFVSFPVMEKWNKCLADRMENGEIVWQQRS